jgi:hypothetical protein
MNDRIYYIWWDDINKKLENLNGRFFVYVLLLGDIAQYVGKSKRVYDRLYCHKYWIEFDIICLIEFDTATDIHECEKLLIKEFQPEYNINLRK